MGVEWQGTVGGSAAGSGPSAGRYASLCGGAPAWGSTKNLGRVFVEAAFVFDSLGFVKILPSYSALLPFFRREARCLFEIFCEILCGYFNVDFDRCAKYETEFVVQFHSPRSVGGPTVRLE